MRRICAWCGSFEGEMTGARTEITHCMCATCVDEKKYCAASALKARGQRAAQIARRHGVPGPSELESDTARPTNRKVS